MYFTIISIKNKKKRGKREKTYKNTGVFESNLYVLKQVTYIKYAIMLQGHHDISAMGKGRAIPSYRNTERKPYDIQPSDIQVCDLCDTCRYLTNNLIF